MQAGCQVVQLVMWPQIKNTDETSRIAGIFADSHLGVAQWAASFRFGFRVGLGEITADPAIEYPLHLFGVGHGAYSIAGHDFQVVCETARTKHILDHRADFGVHRRH